MIAEHCKVQGYPDFVIGVGSNIIVKDGVRWVEGVHHQITCLSQLRAQVKSLDLNFVVVCCADSCFGSIPEKQLIFLNNIKFGTLCCCSSQVEFERGFKSDIACCSRIGDIKLYVEGVSGPTHHHSICRFLRNNRNGTLGGAQRFLGHHCPVTSARLSCCCKSCWQGVSDIEFEGLALSVLKIWVVTW